LIRVRVGVEKFGEGDPRVRSMREIFSEIDPVFPCSVSELAEKEGVHPVKNLSAEDELSLNRLEQWPPNTNHVVILVQKNYIRGSWDPHYSYRQTQTNADSHRRAQTDRVDQQISTGSVILFGQTRSQLMAFVSSWLSTGHTVSDLLTLGAGGRSRLNVEIAEKQISTQMPNQKPSQGFHSVSKRF
jgi:hypothetical protein